MSQQSEDVATHDPASSTVGGSDIHPMTALFLGLNCGFGLRGPPGFHAALVAAKEYARAAALLVVAILLSVSLGTAFIAPLISHGLIALASGAAAFSSAAVAILRLISASSPQVSGRDTQP